MPYASLHCMHSSCSHAPLQDALERQSPAVLCCGKLAYKDENCCCACRVLCCGHALQAQVRREQATVALATQMAAALQPRTAKRRGSKWVLWPASCCFACSQCRLSTCSNCITDQHCIAQQP